MPASVFISYASEDEQIALSLRDRIHRAFGEACTAFVSVRDIRIGHQWREKLQAQLQDTNLVLVLCSPTSVTSAWVLFEAGGAWASSIPTAPLLIDGMTHADLPSPLRDLQHHELTDEQRIGALFRFIGEALNANTVAGFDHHENEREILAALNQSRASSDPDLFLSIPMSALTGVKFGSFEFGDKWKRTRDELAHILSSLDNREDLKNYFFAGKSWEGYEIGNDAVNARQSFSALARSRRFMMILPKKVGSGCLVEAGYAIAKGIPSLYWYRNPDDLPFLLKNAHAVTNQVFIQPYETFEGIARSIAQRGEELFPRRHDS